jgi:hypothetical protein
MDTKIYMFEDKTKDYVDITVPVVTWDDPKGLSFVKNKRYNDFSKMKSEDLKSQIQQFCIHYSVTWDAKSMHSGLNARRLSCNFMIDDDNVNGFATIYQNLPLCYGGYSQGGVYNTIGRGVEIAYMPQAWENPKLYENRGRKDHPIVQGKVHGTTLKVFVPTEAQMKSLSKLCMGMCILCDIPPEFPRVNDDYDYTVTKNADKFSGLVNHYNVSRGKVDTVGLDLKRIERDLAFSIRK